MGRQRSYINVFQYANTNYNLTKTVFVYLAVPETQFIIYRQDLDNSQASKKKLEKYLTVKTKLSINVKIRNTSKHE